MNWLALILGLVKLAQSLADWRAASAAADGAEAKVLADVLARSMQEVEDARAARRDLRDALARDPDRLRADDLFRRVDPGDRDRP